MAQTPWGNLPVNDAHVHFFSRPFYTALARQKKLEQPEALAPLLDWEIPPADAVGWPIAGSPKWIVSI